MEMKIPAKDEDAHFVKLSLQGKAKVTRLDKTLPWKILNFKQVAFERNLDIPR